MLTRMETIKRIEAENRRLERSKAWDAPAVIQLNNRLLHQHKMFCLVHADPKNLDLWLENAEVVDKKYREVFSV